MSTDHLTSRVDYIIQGVAMSTGVTEDKLRGPSRTAELVEARHMAMALIRELLGKSLPQIGAAFGGRDHTTVINALKRVDQLRNADPELRNRIDRLRRQLVS